MYSSHPDPHTLQFLIQRNCDGLHSWFKSNYLGVNESKTKVLPWGQSTVTTLQALFRPHQNTSGTIRELKSSGLAIDSSLSYRALVKSAWKKVNAKVSALRRIRKFIPAKVMAKICKAFIDDVPHLEYCAPVLVRLSPGLSKKLELTNQFAVRTLMKQ